MRRKVYTKDQILKAAHEVVLESGFEKFTARNVAKKMGISTQPIYLEFKNMEDLKRTLLQKIETDLTRKFMSQPITGDLIVDASVHYVEFALKKPKLFKALFVDPKGGGPIMYEYSVEFYKELSKQSRRFSKLPKEDFELLHLEAWIVVNGLITMLLAGIITLTREELIELVQQLIEDISEGKKFKFDVTEYINKA
ncbi:TetR/AcrR family transcriptional regulator [Enterococcus cecorum]|uniref:TetR/AcrR family transcriptional regulator n=1 Tax=Enterococcus cecorum TaxID=44008 RepID=A0AAW9JVB6_9ENTE|nr:TetR/AcrR family transcriptional regulator [Enterococcus cecorum]MDZ5504945.1 TetR/AcrR family transcriptional regulator [Enterococcus cecorum]MDZ5532378.1 TetR/AcrR family transcriptional regulator [Enterococcus cecorum]MDZ5545739.1 TetR/AcrR family transcriptional regulator [Enterococcus cecorum]MDZ5550304.1 TetR/AcrR family transcriptional regulator [Enterococcus cecorum]MDZ5552476.1 TetR/AcrR family transcriptional regulator [Enterococcus cecorum]